MSNILAKSAPQGIPNAYSIVTLLFTLCVTNSSHAANPYDACNKYTSKQWRDCVAQIRSQGQTQEESRRQQQRADQLRADQLHADQLHADQLHADQLRADQLRADQLRADQLHADQLHADQLRADQLRADQLHADQLRADQLRADQLHAEQQRAEQLRADQLHADQLHAEQLHQQQLADQDHQRQMQYEAERQSAEHKVKMLEPLEKPAKIVKGLADTLVDKLGGDDLQLRSIGLVYHGVTDAIMDPQAEQKQKALKSKKEQEYRAYQEKQRINSAEFNRLQDQQNRQIQKGIDLIYKPDGEPQH